MDSDKQLSERPRRVLFMSDHFGHSGGRVHGGTTYFVNTLPALKRAGIQVTVCFMAPRHPAADQLESQGVQPIFLGRSKWDPRSFLDVVSLARRHKIDLMHLCSRKSILFGRIIARAFGIPAIIHLHDAIPLEKGTRLLQRKLARWTAAALAVSEPIREFTLSEFAVSPDRVYVVHNGLDFTRLTNLSGGTREKIRRELAIRETDLIVAVIGRVIPEKGQAEAIRAFERFLLANERAKLLIVGDGQDRARCEALVQELGLGQEVSFTGQRKDIPELLSAVDIVAVPSMWVEPFPFAALEAIAAGKAVIAFRTGGLPAIVVDGVSGLLVERGNIEALAHALGSLARDPSLRLRLAKGAAEHAKKFTIESHVRRLADIYAEVMRKSDAGR